MKIVLDLCDGVTQQDAFYIAKSMYKSYDSVDDYEVVCSASEQDEPAKQHITPQAQNG